MEPTLQNLLSYALTYFSLIVNGPKIRPFHYQAYQVDSNALLEQFPFNYSFDGNATALMSAHLYPHTLKEDSESEELWSRKLHALFEEEVLIWKSKMLNSSDFLLLVPIIEVNKTKYPTEKLLQRLRAEYNTAKTHLRTLLELSAKHDVAVRSVVLAMIGRNKPCGTAKMESCRQREIMVRKQFNDLPEIKSRRVDGFMEVVGDQEWNGVTLRTLVRLLDGNDVK